ncbi:uncharacterized protein LOC119598884 [Penaeus monodon]|uniref:uncharacterized protein LOC119598884 n=1 Tax=Penaeus monodon TaxID=6687 RepID=UPI0018A7958D|nr:uncharacterized protein LOC119598884 [Penaeus monodon]
MRYRAIYALFLLVRLTFSEVFVPGQVWYSTTIQTSFLDPPLATISGSRMKCASLANISPDCYLFCHSVDLCSLYRAQVAAFHQPPLGYETRSCWTRIFDWPTCPVPYQRLPGLEDLGCLRADNSPKSWSGARASCAALGGDLAVTRTSQDFLRLPESLCCSERGDWALGWRILRDVAQRKAS